MGDDGVCDCCSEDWDWAWKRAMDLDLMGDDSVAGQLHELAGNISKSASKLELEVIWAWALCTTWWLLVLLLMRVLLPEIIEESISYIVG